MDFFGALFGAELLTERCRKYDPPDAHKPRLLRGVIRDIHEPIWRPTVLRKYLDRMAKFLLSPAPVVIVQHAK